MRSFRRAIAASSALLLGLTVASALSTTAASATVPGVAADVHISEVFADGGASSGTDATFPQDFIELTNSGTQDEDVSGWTLEDDTDSHVYTIDPNTVITAGGRLAINVNVSHPGGGTFGLGNSGDAARLFDGSTLVDQFWFSAVAGDGNDFNRCAITTSTPPAYAIVVSTGITPGTANDCPTPATALATVKAQVRVNEVLASGTGSGDAQQLDAIELYNTGSTSVSLAGWWLSDDKPADKDVLPAGAIIAPVAITGTSPTRPVNFLTYRVGAGTTSQFLSQDVFLNPTTGAALPGNKDFGLGAGGDNAALVAPDGSDADRLSFGTDPNAVVAAPAAAGNTMSRCPDGSATWADTPTATLGGTNICGSPVNPADTTVKINEVDLANQIVELTNTGTAPADVSGFKLSDGASQSLTIGARTTIPAGGYQEVSLGTSVNPGAAADTITLDDGATTVDTAKWTAAFSPSWGRCPDGTGSFAPTAALTDGAAGTVAGANSCTVGSTAGYNTIRINEVETNGDPLGDWIELTNTGTTDVNISGLYLSDDNGTEPANATFPNPTTDADHVYQIPGTNQNPTDTTTAGNTVLPAHGFKVFFESNSFPFGLGGPDAARIFSPTQTLIDSTNWPAHEAGATFQRCPGITQGVVFTDTADHAAFTNSQTSTPGAANICTPPVRINEVQASAPAGSPDKAADWIELTNVGNQPVDLSGWVLTDDKDSDGDVIPTGTTLNPGAFVYFEPNNENGQFTAVASTPVSKPFGLGASGDEVRLYQGGWDGSTYVAADLVDAFIFEATPGTLTGGAAAQPQTALADGTLAGGSWPAGGDYARCSDGISQVAADGTGAWERTSTPTEGAPNKCDGLFSATPWPDTHNGQAVTTADSVDLGQNVSGLYYVGGNPTTTADDYMWAIQNGSSGLPGENKGDPGALYKLVKNASGTWGPAAGWAAGVPVRYLNNPTGEPDSEGVTAVNGQVYVASERDNTNDTVSKISVLEVNPANIVAQNGDTDGDLNATHEWDLGSDLGPNPGKNPETGLDPSLPGDANLGIEAVAFVPDSYLTSAGFKDEHTGAAYNPATYPNHIDGGVFLVGLEKTGKLYAYVFNSDNTFTRIATISTGFQTIQDLLWDPSQDALWATCDNGCQGRSSIIKVDTAADAHQGTFQVQTIYSRPTGASENLNNEGFTVAPISECVNGSRAAYWSDDTDDANHWLRTASVDCTADTTKPTITATANPIKNAFGWNNTSVSVSFSCTDAGTGVDTADSSLATQVLTASGSVTGTCIDNGGNTATATYTAQIDTVAPTITFAGNKGSYGILDPVAISCTPADALSGVASSTCTGVAATANGPAWTFGAGAHTLSAQVTDQAGNTSSASTVFTVTVKPADLAKLTTQLVQGSAKYQSANGLTKLAVAVVVSATSNVLLGFTPSVTPTVKAALISLYKSELAVLVSSGYLTSAQQTSLIGLAGAI